MIDLENYIFSYVASRLRNAHSGLSVQGEYIPTSKDFPLVTIEQKENAVKQDWRTTKIENMVSVMFEVNTYSNKTKGRKEEAKALMAETDSYFAELGFTRTMLNPIPNLEDSTIYRLTARYEADIDLELVGTDEKYIIYQN